MLDLNYQLFWSREINLKLFTLKTLRLFCIDWDFRARISTSTLNVPTNWKYFWNSFIYFVINSATVGERILNINKSKYCIKWNSKDSNLGAPGDALPILQTVVDARVTFFTILKLSHVQYKLFEEKRPIFSPTVQIPAYDYFCYSQKLREYPMLVCFLY